jgi:hypothetical protein
MSLTETDVRQQAVGPMSDKMDRTMNIVEATRSYERWMRNCTTLVEPHLRSKHAQMKDDLFCFFRGSFYRWAQIFPELCYDLRFDPKVLAVGDLHVSSFGTWRDSEGRMAWGVDDFDESYPLPYSNDLVRLATSLKIVNDSGALTSKFKRGCGIILEAYRETLMRGARPIVLAENASSMEKLGIAAIKPPKDFWSKLLDRPAVNRGIPDDARIALTKMMPASGLDSKIVRREAGMGSLGQQRFVAIAEWNGGCVAREAKAMVPSACVWLAGNSTQRQSFYAKAIQSAIRSHDPFQKIVGRWLIRRLSPDSNPVEIEELSKERDESTLLNAMGCEAANVHLGNGASVKAILRSLEKKKSNWLQSSAKTMGKAFEAEWKEYRKEA